jgi:hypothetical protein
MHNRILLGLPRIGIEPMSTDFQSVALPLSYPWKYSFLYIKYLKFLTNNINLYIFKKTKKI